MSIPDCIRSMRFVTGGRHDVTKKILKPLPQNQLERLKPIHSHESHQSRSNILYSSFLYLLLYHMTMTPLELLYIALTIATVSLTIPLTMILWRTYQMMDRVEDILAFIDRIVGYGKEIEKIPMAIVEKFMSSK